MVAALVAGQIANDSGTSATPTLTNPAAAGNLLVAWAQTQGGTGSVGGPAGWPATFDREQTYGAGGGSAIQIWHKVAAGGEQAMAFSGGAINIEVAVAEFSGVSGVIDVQAGTADGGGTVSSVACAGTTTNAGDLIIMLAGQNNGNGGSNTATNGTIATTAQARMVPVYWIPGSAGAKTSTLGWLTARRAGGLFVAFKPPVVATKGSFFPFFV